MLKSPLLGLLLAICSGMSLSPLSIAGEATEMPPELAKLRAPAELPDDSTAIHPQTAAELAAGIVPAVPRYQELDIRRYGAVCDYDSKSETDGAPARHATDNLRALQAARDVIKAKGGGTMLIRGGGDCYLSNGFDARGISNIHIYVAPDTTVRTTRYTRLGAMLTLGSGNPDNPVRNVGVFGGGTLRNFRPDHTTIPRWQAHTSYRAGDYVLSTDRNGQMRAYYARSAGTSGGAAPIVLNGNQSDGGVSWQDADNDNLVGISGINAFVIDMNMPSASGKFATAQGPGSWKNVSFINNHGGVTNDKGFEVKGQYGMAGQEQSFGDGALIQGNVVESAGREGIEAEQSSNGVNRNRNIRIINNVVKDAGVIAPASGIRVNRADGVELRGNRVLRASGNCYHMRESSNVRGDLYGMNCGRFGAHLQEIQAFSFDRIYIRGANDAAVRETQGSGGGYVGALEVDDARGAGWEAIKRKGKPPVIANYSIAAAGPQFKGPLPTRLPNAKAAAH